LPNAGSVPGMAPGQRNVSLPAHVYDRLNEVAANAGESLATYLTKAADMRRRRDEAHAYAAYCAQPEIAEQIGAFRAGARAYQPAGWRAAASVPADSAARACSSRSACPERR
jgi:hypothetical protein